MSKNSREYRALISANDKLVKVAKNNITSLSVQLTADGLINQEQQRRVRDIREARGDALNSAAELITLVTDKVEEDVSNYSVFLKILQKERSTYKMVLEDLEFEDDLSVDLPIPELQPPKLSSSPKDSRVMPKPTSRHVLVKPDTMQWTFPLLKNDGMEPEDFETLKKRLHFESVCLMEKFADMFDSFFESLSDQEIPIKKIAVKLKTYGAFTPIYKGEHQPLLRDELSKLDLETADIYDIQSIVTDYCSFFNYRILSFLVAKLGTPEAMEQLKQYEKDFAEYAERRVFECPSEIGEMSKGCADLVAKLDHHYEQCTLRQLWNLEGKLCEIFKVSHLNLRFITEGCLRLTFQLPFFVQKAIFPLSHDQEQGIKALHVIRLDCENYHFIHEETNTGLMEMTQVQSPVAQCRDCSGTNGNVPLLCNTHVVCEDCLEKRAIKQPETILKCTTCLESNTKRKPAQVSTTFSYKDALLKRTEKASSSKAIGPPEPSPKRTVESREEPCWIFVYDSNIWITAKILQSRLKKFKTGEDHRVRIDMGKLGDVLSDGRTIVKGTLYGSEPPNIDTVWKKIEEKGWTVKKRNRDEISGKEMLHTQMVADVVEVALHTPVAERSTIILVTGDANIIPAIEVIFDNDEHWKIEVYMWSQAISRKFRPTQEKYSGRLKIEKLDDYINDVTFTSMKFDASNQAFSTTVHQNGVVFIMEPNAFPNQVPTDDWIHQVHRIAKWPFQYYWLEEDGESKTNKLVIVFKRDDKAGPFNIKKFLKNLVPITSSKPQQSYLVPMVQRAVSFKEFEKELETEKEEKSHYNFEQVGSFTSEHVFQGFLNDLTYYVKSYQPGPFFNSVLPIIDWFTAVYS